MGINWRMVHLFFLSAFVFAIMSFGAFANFSPQVAMIYVGVMGGVISVLPRE